VGPTKKPYERPSLEVLGNLEKVTQQGGGNFVDMPIGTNTNGDPNNVIGS